MIYLKRLLNYNLIAVSSRSLHWIRASAFSSYWSVVFSTFDLIGHCNWRGAKHQGPVVLRLIGTNPRLNVNPGFFNSLFKSPFWIIFSVLIGASDHHIVDNFHFKPSELKPDFTLTLGYLNPAKNNQAQATMSNNIGHKKKRGYLLHNNLSTFNVETWTFICFFLKLLLSH